MEKEKYTLPQMWNLKNQKDKKVKKGSRILRGIWSEVPSSGLQNEQGWRPGIWPDEAADKSVWCT